MDSWAGCIFFGQLINEEQNQKIRSVSLLPCTNKVLSLTQTHTQAGGLGPSIGKVYTYIQPNIHPYIHSST